MTGALSADGISFRYPRSFKYPSRSLRGSQPAQTLRNVTLSLTPGAGTALVGSSGSGKSTLVRIMLGLAKPSSGSGHPWRACSKARTGPEASAGTGARCSTSRRIRPAAWTRG